MGFSEGLIIKSLAESSACKAEKVKQRLNEIGDFGETAAKLRNEMVMLKNPKPLTVKNLFSILKEIPKITGKGGHKEKQKKFNDLFSRCYDTEPKWLVRSIQGNLRLGLATASILASLSIFMSKITKYSEEQWTESIRPSF